MLINYKRHWAYMKYLFRHKYYVAIASRQTRAPLWRVLIHDMSKLRPSEWFPYAETFYMPNGTSRYLPTNDFQIAWLKHIHKNEHHWQYWVLREDSGNTIALEMPLKYVREMIADWMGAGRAITGEWEVWDWYQSNKDKMIFHTKTLETVESMLSVLKYYKG